MRGPATASSSGCHRCQRVGMVLELRSSLTQSTLWEGTTGHGTARQLITGDSDWARTAYHRWVNGRPCRRRLPAVAIRWPSPSPRTTLSCILHNAPRTLPARTREAAWTSAIGGRRRRDNAIITTCVLRPRHASTRALACGPHFRLCHVRRASCRTCTLRGGASSLCWAALATTRRCPPSLVPRRGDRPRFTVNTTACIRVLDLSTLQWRLGPKPLSNSIRHAISWLDAARTLHVMRATDKRKTGTPAPNPLVMSAPISGLGLDPAGCESLFSQSAPPDTNHQQPT